MFKKSLQKIANVLHLTSLKLIRIADKKRYHLESSSQVSSLSQSTLSSIVITTFEARFQICLPLIEELRNGGLTIPIYVLINADQGNSFDHSERSKFLSNMSKYPSVFPISLGRKLGMSALWNTGIRCSGSEFVILLNDDLSVNAVSVKETIDKLIELVEQNGLITLNDSFSHFAISSKCISDIGYFDERYLGFGEEDGDYSWRYEDFYGVRPTNIRMSGLSNHSSMIGFEQIHSNELNKYSLFNTMFLHKKYSFGSGGHRGIFGMDALKILPEVNPYPLDRFYHEFSYCLDEESKEVVRSVLDNIFDE